MTDPNKRGQAPDVTRNQFPGRVNFDRDKATLLVGLDKDSLAIGKIREVALGRGLLEKEEVHLTVMRGDRQKELEKFLEQLLEPEKSRILDAMEQAAAATEWRFAAQPIYYHLKKEYNDVDPSNPSKTIPEVRESIIQILDATSLKEFYTKLKDITGLDLETPLPHVTLFTNSTRPDKKLRGVGVYSEESFNRLNPEKIELT